ncbi:hypothetical protein AXE80_05105 [Wenyingzhuangia fucanilytica]|uniref:TonB-dependent receptor plug domain-containing protein n=1 Tax=Wenyingzhuangia fucanilytica TaxID=1790137 RepID=A0A1B1Y4J4_9FLAO|nr:hypothetical protein [Wenyingzhuangia fucanilytica]ANW95692.1 hypothetical protein AXE80_05105 [Wenyingzhuangia fucanilytica]
MKKTFLLLVALLGLFSFTLYTQNSFSNLLEKKLLDYETNSYPEKVYLQTDKPFYALDEDLWFSAYLLNGITHQKTEKSKVLYVELINPKDSIVAKKTLYIEDVSAAGDFKINKNWEEGNYRLRGYTNYMRNADNSNFFSKNISIFAVKNDSISQNTTNLKETVANLNQKSNNKSTKPTLTFFPEGGSLVCGTLNRIAFKIKDDNYSKINVNGVIEDQDQNEIIEFKSIDFGLGSFMIIPEENKTYYAKVFINGKAERYPLPKPLAKGYNLNVTNEGQFIYVKVSSTVENGLLNTFLIAHQRGHLLYKKFESTNKNKYTIKISTEVLKDGVAEITLFDANGTPTAERIVFIDNPKNNLKLNIATAKETFTSRSKVDLNINVTDNKGKNAASTLSMAVRDLNAFPYNSRTNNIKTYLLLNSDLRGNVENPGYFFEKENDPKRKYLLDLVMLTNGWRRFTWQDLLTEKENSNKFKPELGLYISGTTKQLKKPYAEFSSPTRLTFMGPSIFQEPIQQSDSLGKFKFGPYVFFDSIPVLLEARMDHFNSEKRKSRDVVILVDKHTNEAPVEKMPKINQSTKEKEVANFIKVTQYIQQVKFDYNLDVQKLKAVELTANRKTEQEKREEEMDSRTDYGSPISGSRLDVTTMIGAGSFTAFDLVNQLNGVSVFGDTISIRRSNGPARIYLDGMEVDGSLLRSISANEVSFIDLLTGPDTVTFTGGGNGVIAIYSNTGNMSVSNTKRKPGIIDFNAKGFYTARKFYSPDHINGFEEMNKTDLRTTLYWEPLIKTTNTGTTNVSFFTSDIKSDYIIEIEGISTDGQPIHAIKTFNVN